MQIYAKTHGLPVGNLNKYVYKTEKFFKTQNKFFDDFVDIHVNSLNFPSQIVWYWKLYQKLFTKGRRDTTMLSQKRQSPRRIIC